jgi:sporulation protein YlmC with PRC-barrel domain
MNYSQLIVAIGASILLISTTAFAGDKNMNDLSGTNEVEFGEAKLKYRVDEDAAKMIGQDVVNQEGDKIGTIDNILITDTDNVEYAIVSVGGFLGIGEKLVAVPKINLQFNKEKDNVLLKNVTKEQLESAPEFDYSQGRK